MKNGNGSERDPMHPEAVSAEGFLRECAVELRVSVVAVIVLAVIVSGIYPAVVWGLSQALFRHQANGSLVGKDGQPVSDEKQAVGSALIGQNFSDAKYFHPRPSSAGNGYDPTASGGSNVGPTSAKLINGTTKRDDKGNEVVDFDGVHDRIVHYCVENSIPFESSVPLERFRDAQGNFDDVKLIKAFNAADPLVFTPRQPIPADAVTAAGSGLDPQISLENAKLQVGRVARTRGASPEKILDLVKQCTDEPQLALFGDQGVNVLKLNLALDRELPR